MPGTKWLYVPPFCKFCHITFIRKHHLFDRAFSQRFPNMVSFLIIRALTPYINISSQYVFFLAQISDDLSDAWINLAVTFRTLELTHKTHQCGANLQIFSYQKITKNRFSSRKRRFAYKIWFGWKWAWEKFHFLFYDECFLPCDFLSILVLIINIVGLFGYKCKFQINVYSPSFLYFTTCTYL